MWGLKKIKRILNRNTEEQDVCFLTETNRVEDDSYLVSALYAENFDAAEAWGLDSKQQCKDEKTGHYIQFISSLSCDPLTIYGNSGHSEARKANVSLVSAQTEDKEMTFTDRGRGHDARLIWVGVCLALLTLTILVMVLSKMGGG